jgi:hypothetical protein
MIRAAFMLVVPLVSTQVAAAEIAIKCRGESTTFSASPGSPPTVKSELAPDQTFIMDEDKQLVWRWLAPLNKRDQMCNDPSCIKTFTSSKVDLFWQPKADILQWQWGLQLDRLTGHGVWYWQFSRANEMEHVRVDMMCLPTAVPLPIKATRAL